MKLEPFSEGIKPYDVGEVYPGCGFRHSWIPQRVTRLRFIVAPATTVHRWRLDGISLHGDTLIRGQSSLAPGLTCWCIQRNARATNGGLFVWSFPLALCNPGWHFILTSPTGLQSRRRQATLLSR